MGLETKSFEVYGFRIEVHAGGRRVWPPSFKRFINNKMDCGELSVGEIMKTCNVSQSLVYKWRADVRRASKGQHTAETQLFSEIVIDPDVEIEGAAQASEHAILLRGRDVELSLPADYPVNDLVTVIMAIESRS